MRFSQKRHLWCAIAMTSVGLSCSGEDTVPPEADVIRPVRFARVEAEAATRMRTFSGVVRAHLRSNLSFRVAGTVVELPVNLGGSVRPEQLLARLDAVDFELQVQQAEAALRQAEAQTSNIESNLRRTRGLYESNNASRGDLDAAVAAAASAEAQIDSAGRSLELMQRQVDFTRLRAPVEGAVAEVAVALNENVSPGQPIVVLTSGLQEVELAIPENSIATIETESPVTVTFTAIPGTSVPGVVTEVGVVATAFATTFPVRVQLSTPQRDVRPGMAAEVTFSFNDTPGQQRFVVAPESVGEDRAGRFVFLVEPAGDGLGITRRRDVTVGEFVSRGIEILDGLATGDLVVTAGVSKIEDGTQVSLPAEGS